MKLYKYPYSKNYFFSTNSDKALLYATSHGLGREVKENKYLTKKHRNNVNPYLKAYNYR